MKRLVKTLLLTILLIAGISLFTPNKVYGEDLDVIHNYEIVVEPNDDGTLQMTYHINWEVLNDTDEGPLTWARIGIWNKKASNLVSLSADVIEDIEVDNDDGAYINVYFYKDYYKGDVVDFSFSLKQSRVFTHKDDQIQYRFNPGWFDEIIVENCSVYWKKDGVVFSNNPSENNEYLVWNQSLGHKETIDVDVAYEKEHFANIDLKKDYLSYQRQEILTYALIVFLILGFCGGVIFLALYLSYRTSDGYDYHRGFGGTHWYYYRSRPRYTPGYDKRGKQISVPSSSGYSGHSNGGSGHSCACACACACAGGGRAGCSRKDFTKKENLKD